MLAKAVLIVVDISGQLYDVGVACDAASRRRWRLA
jgi:hypothetical protein